MMRSVTITLLAKDGFSKVIDVSEAVFRDGRYYIAVRPAFTPFWDQPEELPRTQIIEKREFIQDRAHLTLFRER